MARNLSYYATGLVVRVPESKGSIIKLQNVVIDFI